MQIYLAPMEGITTFVYRNALHRYYGGVDKYFTPFLSNKNLDYKDRNDVCPEHNEGIPLVPQILTNQAETFLSIAAHLADYGYSEVNLNLGCPSGTVVARRRGAGFLSVPDLLDAFLEEIFTKCPLKISVKTRIGIASLEEWENILNIYAKYPVTELIIHPRLQREFYNGTPHAEAFWQAQQIFSEPSGSQRFGTTLCYNGDITSAASLDALNGKADSITCVMIGRGVIANPELPRLLSSFRENAADFPQKQSPAAEDSSAVGDLNTFLAFHDEILEGYIALMSGEQPVLFRMKELWTYMGSYLNLSDKQLKKLRKANHLSDYRALVRSILSEAHVSNRVLTSR